MRLELLSKLETPVAIDKNAPAFAAMATVTGKDGLEIGVGVLEDLVIKGAGLQPDGRNTELLSLDQGLNGDGRGCDDGDRGVAGVGELRERLDSLVVNAVDADGGGRGINRRGGQVALDVPLED